MNTLLIVAIIIGSTIFVVDSLNISFISWNVHDNKKIEGYSEKIVSELLQLETNKRTPDLYAITLQETCLHCNKDHLHKIALPFINTLRLRKSETYKLISIYDTRRSKYCETMYCSPFGNMHGTTIIMILGKSNISTTNIFQAKVNGCSSKWIPNKEKGIAVIGFTINNNRLCFGGLHLDVKSAKSREKCFADIFKKLDGCNILFFGGDFNTRPNKKSQAIPSDFQNGRNKFILNEMKMTDELSGIKPFSGKVNLLKYISSIKKSQYFEPLRKAPDFEPTYSINSDLQCEDFPVCYDPERFPSWTDRIIYSPHGKVNCSEYNSIRSLGHLSDHLPVYANCKIY